jgi:microcystin-dependent protein
MHKIDGAGHVSGQFVSEDAATGRAPTLVTPEWLNAVQGELTALVEAAGLPLNKNNNQQVSEALAVLSRLQKYTAFTTTGATGAFVLTPSLALTDYEDNPRFRVKFHTVGNGSDTLAVSGLAAKSLKQYDATGTKVAAVIAAGMLTDVEYDGTDFVLLAPLPGNAAGIVVFHAGATAPAGCLKANGAAISRTAYSALFAAIGTTFGAGDGSTTFNLPDLRGEFLRGFDDGRGVDIGRTLGSAQADGFKSHTHVQTHTGTGTLASQIPAGGGSLVATASVLTTGSSGGAETRPRNVSLLACIKF